MPRFFGGGCVGALRAESGIFEDQGAAISEGDFYKCFMNAASESLTREWEVLMSQQTDFVVGQSFLSTTRC